MTVQEMINDLELRGIKCGILTDAIEDFFKHREYCEDILVAEGADPRVKERISELQKQIKQVQSMVVQKTAHYCRFVRERGGVKMVPF